MITTVYIDGVFIINAVLDLFLLLAAGKLSDAVIRKWRLLLAAMLGALYSVAAVFYRELWIVSLLIRLVASIVIVFLAYGFVSFRRYFRLWCSFFLMNFAFAGCVLAITWMTEGDLSMVKLPTLFVAGLLCYAGVALVLRSVTRQRIRESEIVAEIAGTRCALKGFVDTGQCVKDPVTNAPVIVAELEALRSLFPHEVYQTLHKTKRKNIPFLIETLPKAYRFRLIPYRTVGTECDLLLTFRPKRIFVGGKELSGALIAISQTPLSEYGEFNALIGDLEGGT